jgi:hypothetical protein
MHAAAIGSARSTDDGDLATVYAVALWIWLVPAVFGAVPSLAALAMLVVIFCIALFTHRKTLDGMSFTAILAHEGYIVTGNNITAYVPWTKIKDIRLRDGDLYLLTRIGGYYIPRSAFDSHQQAHAFMNAAVAASHGDYTLLRTCRVATLDDPTTPDPSDVWPPPPAITKRPFSHIDVRSYMESAGRLKINLVVFLAVMLGMTALMWVFLLVMRTKFVTSMPLPARLHVDDGIMAISIALSVGLLLIMQTVNRRK